jgi:hypothetical protein
MLKSDVIMFSIFIEIKFVSVLRIIIDSPTSYYTLNESTVVESYVTKNYARVCQLH